MKQKIKKLSKILSRFTIDDIATITQFPEYNIFQVLEELIEEKFVNKISDTEYAYIPKINVVQELMQEKEVNIPITDESNEWITVEQASEITGFAKETIRRKCKRRQYECKYTINGKYKNYLIKKTSIQKDILYNPLKIKLIKKIKGFNLDAPPSAIFNTKEQQEIFDNAEDFNKHHIIKYLNLFKLTDGLRGNDLRRSLTEIGNNNPAYNVSYSSYIRWKAAFIQNGIKGLLKNYHSKDKGKSCVPEDLLQEFVSIYLNSKQYSIRVSWEILKSKHPDEVLPSDKSFYRALTKKYAKKYIQNVRNHKLLLPEIKFNNTVQTPPKTIYEKVNDAFLEELKFLGNKRDNSSICKTGYIKNHLMPYWGKYKFKDITQDALIKYECKMLADGYTTASIKRFVALFQKIINKYSDNTNLIFTSKETLLPSLVINTLTNKEIKEIKQNKARLPELWILCLGISPAELGALDYSDIDYKKRTVKISKTIFRGRVENIRAKYKIRELKIPQVLFSLIHRKTKGSIFKNLSIENYDLLLNTHIKLLLEKNIQINIISRNMGYFSIREFEQRYNFLLPQKLDDDFQIL